MFKRFIDDGFGITKANKFEFEYWVSEFNLLRETITIDKFKYGNDVDFMDLFIFKGERFYVDGQLDVSVFQKEENKYMYIPAKSGHQKHTIMGKTPVLAIQGFPWRTKFWVVQNFVLQNFVVLTKC